MLEKIVKSGRHVTFWANSQTKTISLNPFENSLEKSMEILEKNHCSC